MKSILFFFAALLLFAGQARASDLNLRTEPVSPTAAQSFSVLAIGGGCHLFEDLDPMAREVVVEDGVIRVIVPYLHTGVCVLPVIPVQWTLPGVATGDYRLELFGENPNDFPPLQLLETIDIIVAPGAVAAVPAVIPSLSWWGMMGMVMTVLLLAVWRLRLT